jgi:hypothetical protein
MNLSSRYFSKDKAKEPSLPEERSSRGTKEQETRIKRQEPGNKSQKKAAASLLRCPKDSFWSVRREKLRILLSRKYD